MKVLTYNIWLNLLHSYSVENKATSNKFQCTLLISKEYYIIWDEVLITIMCNWDPTNMGTLHHHQ